MWFISSDSKSYKNQYGFSIVECLFAIVLSISFFCFLLEIYLIGQKSQLLQTALSSLENKAIIVTHILVTEIKKSGDIGCARLTADFPIFHEGIYTLTTQNQFHGTEHSLSLRHASGKINFVKRKMYNRNIIHLTQNIFFKKGDILLISDCKQAEIFIAEGVYFGKDEQQILSLHPLHHQYSQGAQVSRFEANTFYIAKSMQKNGDGTPIYSLFVENIHHHKTELVDHVNRIEFKYSVKTGNHVLDLPSEQISDWSKVVGVAIEFELLSYPFKKIWYSYVSRD